MKKPSIHCYKATLLKELDTILNYGDYGIKFDTRAIVDELTLRLKRHSIPHRSVSEITKPRDRAILVSEDIDAHIVAKEIRMARKKLKHKGSFIIDDTHRDWKVVKEIAQKAIDFCMEFNLTKSKGIKKYIYIGVSLLGKSSFRLLYLRDNSIKICETYANIKTIESYGDKETLNDIFDTYIVLIHDRIGKDISLTLKEPNEYINFIHASNDVIEYGASPDDWVMAQFEALEWTNAIPRITQLFGEKAKMNYVNYINKNHSSEPKEQPTVVIDFLKLKK